MKKVTFGLLGAMVLATTILMVRQQKHVVEHHKPDLVPAGETQPATISLERIREAGF